jgi:hypothetical protein
MPHGIVTTMEKNRGLNLEVEINIEIFFVDLKGRIYELLQKVFF